MGFRISGVVLESGARERAVVRLGGLGVVDFGSRGGGVEVLGFLGFFVEEGLGFLVVLGGVGTAVASTKVGRVMVG